MTVTPEIETIMRTPAFQDALRPAVRNIRNAGREPMELGFQLDDAGNITGPETLSVEAFDQVKRAMRDNARSAGDVNPLTGRVTHNNNSAPINTLAGDLQDQLARQNPAYAAAVSDYADDMALRDALQRGGKVASLTGPEIDSQLRTMPKHAVEAWNMGARTALADQATTAGLKPHVNGVLSMRPSLGLSGAGLNASFGDVAKREAIEATTGRPGVLSGLNDRLEAENQAYQTFDAVRGGSQQLPDQADPIRALTAVMGPATKLATGHRKGALSDVMLRGNPKGTGAYRREVNDRTAELLSATGPQAVQDAMGAIEARGVTDKARQGALRSKATKWARTGALYAASQSADPVPFDDGLDLAEGRNGPSEVLDALTPLYGPWMPPASAAPPRARYDASPIAKTLADGRTLQGFDHAADGTFTPHYGFNQ